MMVVGSNPHVTVNVTLLNASGDGERVGSDVESTAGSSELVVEDISIDSRGRSSTVGRKEVGG